MELTPPSIVASRLLEAPGTRSVDTPWALSTSRAVGELRDAIRRYVRLLDAAEDIPVLAEAIERKIYRGPVR